MSHATLNTVFYTSLVLGLLVGTSVLVWWGKRIFKPLTTKLEQHAEAHRVISLNVVAWYSTIRMLPGILLFALCCTPAIYFGHLLKQRDYCLEVIRVNNIRSAEDAFLKQRCGRLDLKELLDSAR